ncbi:MAG: protein-disulfide reductase DsbD domain-containing protein [Myxococcota bacterium]
MLTGWLWLAAGAAGSDTQVHGLAPEPSGPAIDLSAVPASAAKRGPDHAGKPHPVLARLLTDQSRVAPGSTVRIGIHLAQEPGWHTYWKSPGDIGQPTEVTWVPPAGATATPIGFPVPERFEQDDLVSFGYDREVLLPAVLTVPDTAALGVQTLAADVSWLVCNTSCIPGSAHLELPLEIAAGSAALTAYGPLFDHWVGRLPATGAGAGDDGFAWESAVSVSAVRPNDAFRVAFVLKPVAGAFVDVAASTWPTFTPIAASYDWGLTGVAVRPQPDGTVAVVIDAEAYTPDPVPAADHVGGLVQLKVGDRWFRTEIDAPLPWAAAGAPVTAVDHAAFRAIPKADPAAPQPAEASAVALADPALAAVVPAVIAPGGAGAGSVSLLANLLLAFVGGLILNVMPCVLPVLTLKLYGLVEQNELGAARRRATGLAYSGGVLASFWALALLVVVLRAAFGIQVDWGFQFQYPPYVAALTTVVFAFGLSLLGVFEIPVVGADTADRAASKDGLAGSFFTGVFATLLATPCSAPFLGTAVAYAFGAPAPVLLAVFTAIGAGLAAPFLLIAFVPALFRFVPRPGAWMDTLKHVLGFTLLATTLWLVDVLMAQIGPDRAIGFSAFLLAVGFGAWVYGRYGGLAESLQRQLGVAGVAFGIAALAGLRFVDLTIADDAACDDGVVRSELSFTDGIPWQPFTEPRVDALAGKVVFVDFTAEWCLTCKVNERTVLEQGSVRDAMASLGVVPLKADWTRRDEVITTWLRDHGRAGVPMYLVIPADRTREPILLPEVITAGMVIDALHAGA